MRNVNGKTDFFLRALGCQILGECDVTHEQYPYLIISYPRPSLSCDQGGTCRKGCHMSSASVGVQDWHDWQKWKETNECLKNACLKKRILNDLDGWTVRMDRQTDGWRDEWMDDGGSQNTMVLWNHFSYQNHRTTVPLRTISLSFEHIRNHRINNLLSGATTSTYTSTTSSKVWHFTCTLPLCRISDLDAAIPTLTQPSQCDRKSCPTTDNCTAASLFYRLAYLSPGLLILWSADPTPSTLLFRSVPYCSSTLFHLFATRRFLPKHWLITIPY